MLEKQDGLVSIIVPVYHAAPYIAQTIEMVRAQSCKAWELLLVDDCSGDGSVEEIERALSACRHAPVETDLENVERIE